MTTCPSGRLLRILPLAAVVLAGCGDHSGPLNERGVWRYGFSTPDSRPAASPTGAMPAAPAASTAPAVSPIPSAGATAPPASKPPETRPPESPPPSPPSSSSSGSYRVVKVENGGTIRVLCKLNAPVELPTIEMFKDPEKCGHEKGHRMSTERLVFDPKSLGVGNCLVRIRNISSGKDWEGPMQAEERSVVIDQKGCQYIPHLAVARPGTQVVVKNSDRADHNIHGYQDTRNAGQLDDTKFNFASEPGLTKEQDSAFLDAVATYILKCDIHPWMSGHVVVVPHPYFDKTAAMDDPATGKKAGEAVLTGVPPGEYDVDMWHEGVVETVKSVNGVPNSVGYSPPFGETKHVTVTANGTTDVEIVFPPR